MLKRMQKYYAKHPQANAGVHAVLGLGMGLLTAHPLVGIFGQRKKDRPNTLGLCTVELLEHYGRIIKVRHLDAINGTPVLDIKPFFRENHPEGEFRQPSWVADLMKNYWI